MSISLRTQCPPDSVDTEPPWFSNMRRTFCAMLYREWRAQSQQTGREIPALSRAILDNAWGQFVRTLVPPYDRLQPDAAMFARAIGIAKAFARDFWSQPDAYYTELRDAELAPVGRTAEQIQMWTRFFERLQDGMDRVFRKGTETAASGAGNNEYTNEDVIRTVIAVVLTGIHDPAIFAAREDGSTDLADSVFLVVQRRFKIDPYCTRQQALKSVINLLDKMSAEGQPLAAAVREAFRKRRAEDWQPPSTHILDLLQE